MPSLLTFAFALCLRLCHLPLPFAFALCFRFCLLPLSFCFAFVFCLCLCPLSFALCPFPFVLCPLPLPFAFVFTRRRIERARQLTTFSSLVIPASSDNAFADRRRVYIQRQINRMNMSSGDGDETPHALKYGSRTPSSPVNLVRPAMTMQLMQLHILRRMMNQKSGILGRKSFSMINQILSKVGSIWRSFATTNHILPKVGSSRIGHVL